MDLNSLLEQLSVVQKKYDTTKKQQLLREKLLIEEEVPLLKDFVKRLVKKTKVKNINNEETVLIYVFPSNGKTLISPEVFMTKDGRIVYEIFDEESYRKYRPDAVIENNYNYIEAEEFLRVVPFSDIYNYFIERIELLNEDIEEMVNTNNVREHFLDEYKFSNNLKNI